MEREFVNTILAEVQSAELYLSFFCDRDDAHDYKTSLESFVGSWCQLKARRGAEAFIPSISA